MAEGRTAKREKGKCTLTVPGLRGLAVLDWWRGMWPEGPTHFRLLSSPITVVFSNHDTKGVAGEVEVEPRMLPCSYWWGNGSLEAKTGLYQVPLFRGMLFFPFSLSIMKVPFKHPIDPLFHLYFQKTPTIAVSTSLLPLLNQHHIICILYSFESLKSST